MKIESYENGDRIKVKIGATRKELYTIVTVATVIIGWLARNGLVC